MAVGDNLASQLSALDAHVLTSHERGAFAQMLHDDVWARTEAVHQQDRNAWTQVRSKEEWETFCAARLEALRRSLGTFSANPGDLHVHRTSVVEGDGYRIENLVYESRPGVLVTANLYLPSPLRESMPAVVLVHSHHNPKTQGELQDMGMTWARIGCMVLVMDLFGYGERRQHAPGPRQDYRFRYIHGIQLHLIGDSLMGWMVWDVMRGIDLLRSRPDMDRGKLILIGAVAGGGDPAAVAAAIDPRITCVVPFNFGGPQPETIYPLPEDAEETFNYMGGGSWESTRNLRLSGQDGFLPWVIVASVAPRYLIYAHEFSWDRTRDPVWKRLEQVFAWYDASDHLDFAHGAGVLSGRPPEATHCNNVGPVHRKMIYPALERWFDIPIPQEYQNRLPEEKLTCRSPEISSPPLHELYAQIGDSRAAQMRSSLAALSPRERRTHLCQEWARLLGDLTPQAEPTVRSHVSEKVESLSIERVQLQVDPRIVIPMLLLRPRTDATDLPIVVAVSQYGKERFLRERAKEIGTLLMNGIAVCLPDLRGMGETRPRGARTRQSEITSISATEWMLGGTLLGSRLRDLRSVLRYLRERGDVNAHRIALWGDSFAPTNPSDFIDPPMDGGESPQQSEPAGGLLALFGALYEEDVCLAVARGMIAGYRSILRDRFCYVPHDVIVPGALTAGDLCDIAAALAPHPLRIEAPVDGRNCPMPAQEFEAFFEPTREAYRSTPNRLSLVPGWRDDLALWLCRHI